jgi:hypothetical protein
MVHCHHCGGHRKSDHRDCFETMHISIQRREVSMELYWRALDMMNLPTSGNHLENLCQVLVSLTGMWDSLGSHRPRIPTVRSSFVGRNQTLIGGSILSYPEDQGDNYGRSSQDSDQYPCARHYHQPDDSRHDARPNSALQQIS